MGATMKNSMRQAMSAALLAGGAMCLAAPSYAEPSHPSVHPHVAPHSAPGGHFGPNVSFVAHADFAHFSPAQHAAWVGGRWNHGWHNGHFGWWWFAGGAWYFYDAPIYPYPLDVSDEYYVDETPDYGNGGPYWYYCQSPAGYYPYVQQCSAPWQPVPATPPPPPPGSDQGPGGPGGPPPSANGYQGPPPGYDQGPPPNDDRYPDYQGPPPGGPGPGNQGPPPGPNNGPNG
jgi:hypothetical protein